MLISGILCEMHSYPHALFVFVAKGLRVVSILVLLSITVLYWFCFHLVFYCLHWELVGVVGFCTA